MFRFSPGSDCAACTDGVDLELGSWESGLAWRWVVTDGSRAPGKDALLVDGGDHGEFALREPAAFDSRGNRLGGKKGTRDAGAADLMWSGYFNFVKTAAGAQSVAVDPATGAVVNDRPRVSIGAGRRRR